MYTAIVRGLVVLAGTAIYCTADSATTPAAPVSTIPVDLPTSTVSTAIDGQTYSYQVWTTTVASWGAMAEPTTDVDVNDDTATIIYPLNPDYGPEDTVVNVIFEPILALNDLHVRGPPTPIKWEDLVRGRPAFAADEKTTRCPKPAPKCDHPNCQWTGMFPICKAGPWRKCLCKPSRSCPSDDKKPLCINSACKGNEINRCTSKGDLQGCDCRGPKNPAPVLDFYDPQWLKTQNDIIQAIIDIGAAHPDPPALGCTPGSSSNKMPESLVFDNGPSSPNYLLKNIQYKMCQNKCEVPDHLGSDWQALHKIYQGPNGECEISVAVQNGFEAFFHRAQDPQFDQKDHCASTLAQLDSCVANAEKVAESADHTTHQTYTFGFRPMNDGSSKHDPFDGKHYLKDANNWAPECYADFMAPAVGDRDAFARAASEFCLAMKGGGPLGQPAQKVDPDHLRPQVCPLGVSGYVFDVFWNTDACGDPNNAAWIDFSTYSQGDCVGHFTGRLEECVHGGQIRADCAIWAANSPADGIGSVSVPPRT